ncbi:12537_t:CDS:1, partial [Gigaspora rosea]
LDTKVIPWIQPALLRSWANYLNGSWINGSQLSGYKILMK